MTRISSDGQVLQSNPWSLSRVIDGILDVVFLFFRTLVGSSRDDSQYSIRGGSRAGFRSGSGLGSRRQIGRIGRIHTLNVPMSGGGCAGGACGR